MTWLKVVVISPFFLVLLLVVWGGAWGQSKPQFPPIQSSSPSSAPAAVEPARLPASASPTTPDCWYCYTAEEMLVGLVIAVVGLAASWVISVLYFQAQIKRRLDPSEAFWQTMGWLLVGAWIFLFFGFSKIVSGAFDVNWWVWGTYLVAGSVLVFLVRRVGRQPRVA